MNRLSIGLVCFFLWTSSPIFCSAETLVRNANIQNEVTWDASGSPYLVEGDVYIGTTGVLNIKAGTEVKMQGSNKFEVLGNLNIAGQPDQAVVLTSAEDNGSIDPVISNTQRWGGLVFHPGSKADISFLHEKYTGFIYYPPGGPSMTNLGGEVSIRNSKFDYNYWLFELSSGTTTVSDSSMDHNSGGIHFTGGYMSLVGSQISDTSGPLIASPADNTQAAKIFMRDVVFSNNLHSPYLDLSLDFDIASTTILGGDFEGWTISGHPKGEKTLASIDGKPYRFYGAIVETDNKLIIAPGTTLKGGYIVARGGEVDMQGIEEEPVVFTSATENPMFDEYTSGMLAEMGGKIKISHVIIKNAGAGQVLSSGEMVYGSLINSEGEITADHLQIMNSRNTAIHHQSGTTTIISSSINGQMDKAIVYKNGNFKMSSSSIDTTYRNYSLNNIGSGLPDVRNNYWGTVEGPYHSTYNASGTAPRIEGEALFIPFLTAPPSTSTPPQKLDPVIIIPGIMGSAYKDGEWTIDPIFHVYDNLILTLINNGYAVGKDLFAFPYDWKNSNVKTAGLLKKNIDKVKEICHCSKVDLIAHSMGGLVARQYIQSDYYGDDVDQLIFLGTPHRGAPKDYLTWEAGEIFGNNVQSTFLRKEMEKDAKRNGYTGDNALFKYVRDWPIKSVQELLPTYDYLKDATTSQRLIYPDGYPENTFLEDLNSDLIHFLESNIKITNIIGDTEQGNTNTTISSIRITYPNKLPLWENGYPENYDKLSGDHGLELGKGDGTVPELSSKLGISSEITLHSSHIDLPTDAEEEIYEEIHGGQLVNPVKTPIPLRILFAKMYSPADFVITDSQGRRVGKFFDTSQEINEIPGAFYSGFNTDDEYITIPNPVEEEYTIQLQGTGNGGSYEFETTFMGNDFSTTTRVAGITEPNQITNLKIQMNNQNPNNLSLQRQITLELFTKDIEGSYKLGWIKDEDAKNKFIKTVQDVVKFDSKKNMQKVDKILAKALEKDLEVYYKVGRINSEAYNLIKDDLNYLISNK